MTTELLTDPGHTREDLRIVETAIRKGWLIPDQLLEALPKVAGAMALKGKPRDQIAAMKVLLAMKEQNDKPEPQKQQTVVNVGVNVDNRTDDRRAEMVRVVEQLRAERLLRDAQPAGVGSVPATTEAIPGQPADRRNRKRKPRKTPSRIRRRKSQET